MAIRRQLEGCKEEGQHGNLAQYEGGTRGGGMALEDGALRQIESVRASGIDDDGLLRLHLAFCEEGLLAVVDEDFDARIVGKDHVRGLRGVKGDGRVVDDVAVKTEPGIRQLPLRDMVESKGQEGTLDKDLAQVAVLQIENRLSQQHHLLVSCRRTHGGDPLRRLLDDGLHVAFVLNGLVGDARQDLADAAILVGRAVPAIDAVNDVKPVGRLLLREEVAKGQHGRAALGVDGSRGPVIAGGRVVIDAVHGESTDPGLAYRGVKADVDQQDVGVHHLFEGRQARARGRRRIHFDVGDTLASQGKMSEVGGEPAVDAVAMEDDLVRSGRLRSLRHDWKWVDIKNRKFKFQFFTFDILWMISCQTSETFCRDGGRFDSLEHGEFDHRIFYSRNLSDHS